MKDGVFEVKATGGDTHLGGEDFNSRMVNHFVDEFQRRNGNADLTGSKRALARLRKECDKAKLLLSSTGQAEIAIDCLFDGIDLYTSITRAKFEEHNADLFKTTILVVETALSDARMSTAQIHDIVLVGGSTRIPKVRKLLSDFFGGKKLRQSINPDEAVAYGAAVQAAILQAGDHQSEAVKKLLLHDVTALSLGIKLLRGTMDPIIRRNTPIPTGKITKEYCTSYDNQESLIFTVYEGEQRLVKHNNLLGRFDLEGIPSAPREVEKIDVTFDIEAVRIRIK